MDRLALHEKIAFEKLEGCAIAMVDPRGLRGQDYTVHFLHEGAVGG